MVKMDFAPPGSVPVICTGCGETFHLQRWLAGAYTLCDRCETSAMLREYVALLSRKGGPGERSRPRAPREEATRDTGPDRASSGRSGAGLVTAVTPGAGERSP